MKALAAFALVVPLLLPAVAAANAASRSHRSEQLHYAISFPATWTPLHVRGADFARVAPDRNGFLSVSVTNGVLTTNNRTHAVKYSFGSFGRPVKPPEIEQVPVPGTTGTQATATVTTPAGRFSTVCVFLATYKLRIYTVIGVVRDINAPGAQFDVAAVLTMIRSTAFFP